VLNRKKGDRGPLINRENIKCCVCSINESWRDRWLRIDNGVACYKCYLKWSYNKRKQYSIDKNGKRKKAPCETTYEYRFNVGKKNAKNKNREWKLTQPEWEDIVVKGCFYCGTSLREVTGCSLDRIDNTKGYVLDNVLPCCGFCNRIRSDLLTIEENQVAINAILKYRREKYGIN
jgi:hypothetical protein